MKPIKAPGLDGVTAGILRKAWPVIGQDITELFRTCITQALFPASWKKAKLVIVPKPGKKDKMDPRSYRPVNLLPAISKALESLIIQELEQETRLNECKLQHAFVPGRSTSTAIK